MTNNPITLEHLQNSYPQRQQLYNIYNGEETKPIKKSGVPFFIIILVVAIISFIIGFLIGKLSAEQNLEVIEDDIV
jgi:hypothetical protein